MSYMNAILPDHPLCGTWSPQPQAGTGAYSRVEYTISVIDRQFVVRGVDRASGEQLVICDVAFDGEWLRFTSLQPSSGRSGSHWVRIVDKDKIEFRFTLSDREVWARRDFRKTQALAARGLRGSITKYPSPPRPCVHPPGELRASA